MAGSSTRLTSNPIIPASFQLLNYFFSTQLAFHLAVGSDLGGGDEQEEQQAGGSAGEEEQQDQRRAGEEREPGFQVFYQTFSESSLFIQVPGADDKKSFTQLMN